jgi:surfeit locus 1 family protein
MSNARPRLAAAAVVTGIAVLIGLGTWQLARRAEKHTLIALIESRMAAPPVALPAVIGDADAFDYRRVVVAGHFLHGKEMRVLNRVLDGRAGVHVVTPLARDGATAVLVNRGWAPGDHATPVLPLAGAGGERVTVTGIARVPRPPGPFVPANDAARGLWYALDIAAMATVRDLRPVAPVVVWADAAPGDAGGYPRGGQAPPMPQDNHLSYALTWYSLALALAVIAVIARRRARRRIPPS